MPNWRRIQWYGVLAVGVAFSAGGIFIAVTRDPSGWVIFLFFLLCVAMAVHELWPQVVEGKPPLDDPHDILRLFPGPVRLRVPKRKLVFFFVSSIVFSFCLVWVALHGDLNPVGNFFLWLGAAGCVAAFPVFLPMILRGSTLRLDAEGFEVFQGLKRSKFTWIDASEFSVADAGVLSPAQNLMVVFDDALTKDGTIASLNRSLIGRSGALPDTYGLEPEELAWLLNQWRQRALAKRAPTLPPASRSRRAP